MRVAAVLVGLGLAIAGGPAWPAPAIPGHCPPHCDRIPDSAWLDPAAIPLDDVYEWPGLAALAVTARAPRFRFEEACATPPATGTARDYAVAARAVVTHPDGQWQLQVQIIHWRGETWRGGPAAMTTVQDAVAALRACQATSPLTSPSITTLDDDRMAAVISGPLPGPGVLHEYLLAHPRSATVAELAMWAATPPLVGWPSVPDEQILDALTVPLCAAYLGSCR